MNGRWIPFVPRLLSATLLALLLPPGTPQESEADRVKGQIRSRIEALHSVRAQHLARIDSAELETAEVQRQIERLETDVEEVRVYIADARVKSAELERNIAAADAFSDRGDAFLDGVSGQASEALAGWRPTVDGGVAWARDHRLAQLDRLAAALETQGEERERALLEFWSFLSEELRLSHTLDERNELLPLAGGPRSEHAYVLRLGLLQEVFVTEDGAMAGMYAPASGWMEESDPLAAETIKQLMKVARGKAAADLTSTPFPTDRVRRGN